MPITTFEVGSRPCMSPGTQANRYSFPTELNKLPTCPIEINSGLQWDPNFVQQSSTAFETNAYAVQSVSGVYSMLISMPSYYYYVQSPVQMKRSELYYAWQRPTSYWDIECEWNGSMDRQTAATYYSQEFVNPTDVQEAEDVSNALLWISGIYICLLFCCLFLLCWMKDFDIPVAIAALCALCARISWFVTVPILFHRLNVSNNAAQVNLGILVNQKSFLQYSTTCGDPIYALDYTKASDMMEDAATRIDQAWKFSLATLIIICLEVALPFVVICLYQFNEFCCSREDSYYKNSSKEIVYNEVDYTGGDSVPTPGVYKSNLEDEPTYNPDVAPADYGNAYAPPVQNYAGYQIPNQGIQQEGNGQYQNMPYQQQYQQEPQQMYEGENPDMPPPNY